MGMTSVVIGATAALPLSRLDLSRRPRVKLVYVSPSDTDRSGAQQVLGRLARWAGIYVV